MTIEQLEKEIEGYKVIRHRGQCFINVRSKKEADRFSRLKADVFPFPAYSPGYEVHLQGMLDPVVETLADGEEVDVTRAILLEHFRERDGYFPGAPHSMTR